MLELTSSPAGQQGLCTPRVASCAQADVSRYFAELKVESDYLIHLLDKVIGIILSSGRHNDLRFGSVVEGHTVSGGIAEVTSDHCIRIDSYRLMQHDETVAMALLAHDHLRHFKTWKNNLDYEHAADNLAKAWGFNINRFRKSRISFTSRSFKGIYPGCTVASY